ncbi:MAG: LPS assembly protein LptD [Holosporaceae bacterium]|jgi:LPS-assembly protein|nr:LPS assembly protein LptD [Holosporaceae bacterium]
MFRCHRAQQLALVLGCITFQVFAGEVSFINSDTTKYTKNRILCSGNVVIVYYGRIIAADNISYDKKTETIEADGNIIIKDEKQNTYFLDRLMVRRDFSDGYAKNVKIISNDKSRLAANWASIRNGIFEVYDVVYSPCYECNEAGEITWQIKSTHVKIQEERDMEYENASFEVFGQPIFTLPFLSHPNPKIKRKSGFLAPQYSTSNHVGIALMPIYLFSISDSQELLFKPIITSEIGVVLWAYYGYRLKHGELCIDASITNTNSVKKHSHESANVQDRYVATPNEVEKIIKSGYRGHIFAKFRYEIDEMWKCGADINLVSDHFYLRRFPFFQEPENLLETNIKLEKLEGRNYSLLGFMFFQDLHGGVVPRILPVMEKNFSIPFAFGTLDVDTIFVNFDFNDHRSSQKLISNVSISKCLLLPKGHIIDLKGLLSLRILRVSEKEHSDYDSKFSLTPQLSCIWKWPLMLNGSRFNTIFTPIIGLIISANKKYFDIFEDQFCDINSINFADGSRSISQYGIDPGSRICYGLKASFYTKDGDGICDFVLGRSVELSAVAEKNETTGMKHKHSNIVAALNVQLSDTLAFVANCSYATQSRNFLRFESGLKYVANKVGIDLFVFNGQHSFYDPFNRLVSEDAQSAAMARMDEKYKGIMLDTSWKITPNIALKAKIVLGDEQRKLIRYSAGVEYNNECSSIDLVMERKNYQRGDLEPEASIKLVVSLKNLG